MKAPPVAVTEPPRQRAQLIVWWTVWVALIAGVSVIYVQLGGRPPSPERQWSGFETVAVGLIAISAVVRWLVLPRLQTAVQAFPLFIVGLALAEAPAFVGIFLSHYAAELFVLSLLGMLQFAPFFARRYVTSAA